MAIALRRHDPLYSSSLDEWQEAVSILDYRFAAAPLASHQPHGQDEVYYVLAGRAKFTGSATIADVAAAMWLFVPCGRTTQPSRHYGVSGSVGCVRAS